MKKRRLLKNGQIVRNASTSVPMTIDSKCPKKWLFVDMETGDVWMHKSRLPKPRKAQYTFYRADPNAMRALDNIMTDIKCAEMGINREMP